MTLYNNYFWLKRAIHNIVFNAIKYNKQNGTIFIKIDKEKSGYLISIKDTGQGIHKNKIKEIFKKYNI